MNETPVLYQLQPSGVGLITLNSPANLNALTPDMIELLITHIAEAEQDPQVRCVALTGTGRGFCAGTDIKVLDKRRFSASPSRLPESERKRLRLEGLQRIQDGTSLKLHTMAKPTVAIVNGFAIGAGFSLAMACDLRLCGEGARLSTGFRNLAASGDMGGTYFLSKLLGEAKVRELIFTGETLAPEQALGLDLINRIYPDDELLDCAMAFCAELAEGPTYAFGLAKANLVAARVMEVKEALDFEAGNMIDSLYTEDHKEAVKAFMEKRKPCFSGR